MATRPNDWTDSILSDGRYVISAKLGEGGMGVVYRAEDRKLEMDVVIKVPRRAMLDDPDFAHRFAREIRSLVKLSHPGIVKVTDVGQFDDLPFAVMQFLSGGSLEDRIFDGPAGPRRCHEPKTLVDWLPGIASALDYIHTQGYVHRDVKPGNILFDAQGHAFLSDFGVAKALAAAPDARSGTGTGLVLGTPEYMAPELIMGETFNGCVDQYALAITVYEILCGRRPFEGSNASAILVVQTTTAPPPLLQFRPTIPARLSEAVLKGLAKDPAQRYASCAVLAATVVAAATGSPDLAPGGSGSGQHRPDLVRLACPNPECKKTTKISTAAYNEMKRTGQSINCPGCQTLIPLSTQVVRTKTVAMQAQPATSIDTPLTSGTGNAAARTPIANQRPADTSSQVGGKRTASGTVKLTSPDSLDLGIDTAPKRAVTEKLARPRSATVIERTPALPEPDLEEPALSSQRSLVVWIGATAAVGFLLVVGVIFAFKGSAPAPVVNTVPPVNPAPPNPNLTPPEGTILIRLPELATGAEILVDGNPCSFQDLHAPQTLPVGTHLISVSKDGLNSLEKTFSVRRGSNRDLVITLELAKVERKPPIIDPPVEPKPPLPPEGTKPEKPPVVNDPPAVVVSNEPVEVNLSADKIVAAPEKFAGKVVIPSGLYCLASSGDSRRNGRGAITALEGELIALTSGGVRVKLDGKSASLDVDPEFASRLVSKGGVGRGTTPGSNVAMLTIRVSPSPPLRCELIKAEFLTNLDFVLIGQDKFKRAFQSLTLSADQEHLGAADGDKWKDRVGLHFTKGVKNLYKLAKNQQSQAKWSAFNQQMGSMISSSVAGASKAAADGEAARRAAVFGK